MTSTTLGAAVTLSQEGTKTGRQTIHHALDDQACAFNDGTISGQQAMCIWLAWPMKHTVAGETGTSNIFVAVPRLRPSCHKHLMM
jgi:hypothetical protein